MTIGTNAVRVTFDKPARAFDDADHRDALNPRNWTVSHVTGGWAPSVVRVDALGGDGRAFDLNLMGRLAAGEEYAIGASADIESAI